MTDGVRADSAVLALNWLNEAHNLRQGVEIQIVATREDDWTTRAEQNFALGTAAGLEQAARELLNLEVDNAS